MAPAFSPFEVSIPHIAYACLGGFVVLFGMFSLFLREKLYIGEACWAFIFGVIIGPYGANIFNPRGWGGANADITNTITLEFTRVVLAIGVFAIGVELPKAYMARHWKSLFFLLGPVMTWGWFVSAGLIFALIPGLNFLSSLAVAACLTPTDPILAAAVVGGKYADKHVPAHLRHLLAAESGCNDGAAFPFLYIALYLIIDAPNTGKAVRDWFLLLWLYEVVLGVCIGGSLGFGFRYLMKFCQRHDLIDRHSYVAQYVSLAMLTIGVTTLLGSDDLLSAFACGTAFAWDGFFNRQTEESVFSSVIDLLFNIAAFVFVGAWMPFSSFSDQSLTLSVWRLIVIAILVLLLRRLPVMIAMYKWIPDIKTFREAIFSGHFGPIGVGAVFISTLAAQVLRESLGDKPTDPQNALLVDSIQPIVAFMVLCSITIHGLSIPSFSLGRRVHTVSRTWSRAASILPDWTNQARLVERGQADIVVNRDPVAEPLSDLEKGNSVDSTTVKEETPSPPGGSLGETASPSGQEPPDGREIISEWQEGPHRIIERRAGPGEEVEVEVIRNYHDPELEDHSKTFRGTRSTVHEQVGAYINKLRVALEQDIEKMEEGVERVREIIRHGSPPSSSLSALGRRQESPVAAAAAANDNDGDVEDEEEGWASEPDAEASSSTGVLSPSQRKRSKSPKTSPTFPSKRTIPKLGTAPAPSKKGRRRNSMRRGVITAFRPMMPSLGPTSPTSPTSPSAVFYEDSDSEDARGRTDGSPSSPGSSRAVSLRHARVDSLRSPHGRSRDHSPARSVHFFDEGRSGTTTPRGDVTSRSVTPDVEEVEGRGKVTFELPKSPTGAKH